MKAFKLILIALMAGSFPLQAMAEDDSQAGTTQMKMEDTKEPNTTPGGDVDELITNVKMRAETGSKSRWSLSSDWAYNGGSIEKPLAPERPNITGMSGSTDNASLNGAVATKYNINKQHSLALGVGLRWIAPLESQKPKDFNGERFDADNPYLNYQYIYKWAGIQSALAVRPLMYTNSNLTRLGYVAGLTIEQNNIYEVGNTGLSIGVYTALLGGAFNKTGALGTEGEDGYIADVRGEQSDYGFNIDPFIEYQLNDRITLRTVSNLWNYEHIRNEPRALTFYWPKVYQSVGVGVSVTRDIFIYPNVQFLPDDVRADRTNVAINSNINIF